MNNLTLKIINYKGRITTKWQMPKTPRGVISSAVKLLRFYYRCKTSGLLYPELIRVLKKVVEKYFQHWAYVVIAVPEVATMFKEIQNLPEETEGEYEIVEEKIRRQENTICAICKVKLVYPAYIVRRKGSEIVSISKPVGIRCLNNRAKKLEDLIKEIEINLEGDSESGNSGGSTTTVIKTESQNTKQLLLF